MTAMPVSADLAEMEHVSCPTGHQVVTASDVPLAASNRTINGSSRDRRYPPAFSIAAASRPSKVEPGSDHGSSQS